jgi:hypothetical protein
MTGVISNWNLLELRIPPNLPFKKGRSCHLILWIRVVPLFFQRGVRGDLKNQEIESSKFGIKQHLHYPIFSLYILQN